MRIGRSISPAFAALEAEVTARIADVDAEEAAREAADTTHAAKKTTVHGVGAAYLAKTSVAAQTLSDAEIPDAIARDLEVVDAIEFHRLTANAHHIKTLIAHLSPIALANLVDAVCSETEADDKIDAYPPSMTDEWKQYIMVYGL